MCLQMVSLLHREPHVRPCVLGVLYHLSLEAQHRAAFTASNCVPRIFELLPSATHALLEEVPQLPALALCLSQDEAVILVRMRRSRCWHGVLARVCQDQGFGLSSGCVLAWMSGQMIPSGSQDSGF